jgi:signal transduction histidine kinase
LSTVSSSEQNTLSPQRARQELLADLFHALNQPITALHCSLELGLHAPRSVEQYRDCLQKALRQVEEVGQWTAGINDLIQACEQGENIQELSLKPYIREVVELLRPVMESRSIRCVLSEVSPCTVLFVMQRLKQVLFYAMQFVLDSIQDGGEIEVQLRPTRQTITLEFSGFPIAGDGTAEETIEGNRLRLKKRLILAIAEEALIAAHGGMSKHEENGKLLLTMRWPAPPFAF